MTLSRTLVLSRIAHSRLMSAAPTPPIMAYSTACAPSSSLARTCARREGATSASSGGVASCIACPSCPGRGSREGRPQQGRHDPQHECRERQQGGGEDQCELQP